MNVESREYKLLIDHRPFSAPNEALKQVWAEIKAAAKTAPFETKGKPGEVENRTVLFLDTPDHTLRAHGLVLRQRKAEHIEYTLKCRSEDRYFAAGTDVSPAKGRKCKPKMEEDIAPPFLCRYSHSATIIEDAGQDRPGTLREAASLFPLLGRLQVNDRDCDSKTTLKTVNGIEVEEQVWEGEILLKPSEKKTKKASVALIVWTRAELQQPAIVELSFRLKDKDEDYGRKLAEAARETYSALQRMDCAQTAGMTKTEYIYRDHSRN